jgi:hypothetical protein
LLPDWFEILSMPFVHFLVLFALAHFSEYGPVAELGTGQPAQFLPIQMSSTKMSEQIFKYREGSEFDFSNAPVYRKATTLAKSQVEVAKSSQEVVTVINGKEETRNTASAGDHIVTGVKGEKYIIKAGMFPGLYEEDPADPSRYISKNVIRALVLSEDTELTAPWGERQRAEKGGVVAQRVDDPKDIYLIEKGAFESTYALEASKRQRKSPSKTFVAAPRA